MSHKSKVTLMLQNLGANLRQFHPNTQICNISLLKVLFHLIIIIFGRNDVKHYLYFDESQKHSITGIDMFRFWIRCKIDANVPKSVRTMNT